MLNPTPWVVHKFGGSSVADADCFRKVAAILDSAPAARLGEVLTPAAAQLYLAALKRDCQDLVGVLHSVKLTRAAAHNVRDLIAGYGEIWSTLLFQRFF